MTRMEYGIALHSTSRLNIKAGTTFNSESSMMLWYLFFFICKRFFDTSSMMLLFRMGWIDEMNFGARFHVYCILQ